MISIAADKREVLEQELGALIKRKDLLDGAFESAMEGGYREESNEYRVFQCEVFKHFNQGLKGLF